MGIVQKFPPFFFCQVKSNNILREKTIEDTGL
jgi:hypothetical protein